MSNQTALLSILAMMTTVFFGGIWVNTVINGRGDEIQCGVVKGVPVSTRYRRLMLFTQWLPYTVFTIAFLLVMALGILEIGREVDESRIAVLGYSAPRYAPVPRSSYRFWALSFL